MLDFATAVKKTCQGDWGHLDVPAASSYYYLGSEGRNLARRPTAVP